MIEFFAYAVNAALIALGAAVTVNPTWAERKKAQVGGSMVALGCIALILTGVQSSRESAELKNALTAQTQLANANLKLQGENLTLAQENRDLSTKVLRAALGDPDKPPYIYFDFSLPEDPMRSRVYIHNSSSEHAAHSVTASVRLDGDAVTSAGTSVAPSNRVPAQFPNRAGLQSNRLKMTELERVGGRMVVVAVIASSAGSYQQVTGLVRSSETVVLQSVRVSRLDDRSNVIFARQDKTFPEDFVWPRQSAEKE